MSPLAKETFDKLNVPVLKMMREKFVMGSTLIVNPKYPEEGEEAFIVCLNDIFSELLVDMPNHEGLVAWNLMYSFGFDLKCKRCGHVYKHGITREKLEDEDPSKYSVRYRGIRALSKEKVELTEQERIEQSKKFNIPIDDVPKELVFTEIEYRKCPKCFPPPPQAVYGVPPDVAKLKPVTLVKFLLMCLKPGSMLSKRRLCDILQYSAVTIDRILTLSEKEDRYYYQGLKEHLLSSRVGRVLMYCLKPESYVSFRQEYDIRQIRKLMERYIGPSMYKDKFIPLD